MPPLCWEHGQVWTGRVTQGGRNAGGITGAGWVIARMKPRVHSRRTRGGTRGRGVGAARHVRLWFMLEHTGAALPVQPQCPHQRLCPVWNALATYAHLAPFPYGVRQRHVLLRFSLENPHSFVSRRENKPARRKSCLRLYSEKRRAAPSLESTPAPCMQP